MNHNLNPRSTSHHKGMREQYLCPHDGKHCARAKNCQWSKTESCATHNAGMVHACAPRICRKKFGKCVWKCSRDKDR
jgi:hypothetical protein